MVSRGLVESGILPKPRRNISWWIKYSKFKAFGQFDSLRLFYTLTNVLICFFKTRTRLEIGADAGCVDLRSKCLYFYEFGCKIVPLLVFFTHSLISAVNFGRNFLLHLPSGSPSAKPFFAFWKHSRYESASIICIENKHHLLSYFTGWFF